MGSVRSSDPPPPSFLRNSSEISDSRREKPLPVICPADVGKIAFLHLSYGMFANFKDQDLTSFQGRRCNIYRDGQDVATRTNQEAAIGDIFLGSLVIAVRTVNHLAKIEARNATSFPAIVQTLSQ